MAFMAPPAAVRGDTEDRPPVLSYNAKAGRLLLHDRAPDANGEWSTTKTDVTMDKPAFAVDFGRLDTGWILFAPNAAPVFLMAPYPQPAPSPPDSPGTTAAGRARRFKLGFRLPVIGREIGGLREFAGNARVLIDAMNDLHTAYEAAPEARTGKIPLVRMTNVTEVRAGQSSNYQPTFTIVQWVDRPQALGPRTVAPPGPSVVNVAGRASADGPRPAARAAAAPVRDAWEASAPLGWDVPPDDRWGDEGATPPDFSEDGLATLWRGEVARLGIGARPPAPGQASRQASYDDDTIPF